MINTHVSNKIKNAKIIILNNYIFFLLQKDKFLVLTSITVWQIAVVAAVSPALLASGQEQPIQVLSLWNWKKSSTSTGISAAPVELNWPLIWPYPNARSRSGSRTGEWSTRRRIRDPIVTGWFHRLLLRPVPTQGLLEQRKISRSNRLLLTGWWLTLLIIRMDQPILDGQGDPQS